MVITSCMVTFKLQWGRLSKARALCRFTLDELEGFLETAKECIPGVKEAIIAANSHKAHQVIHP